MAGWERRLRGLRGARGEGVAEEKDGNRTRRLVSAGRLREGERRGEEEGRDSRGSVCRKRAGLAAAG